MSKKLYISVFWDHFSNKALFIIADVGTTFSSLDLTFLYRLMELDSEVEALQ